MNIYLDLFLTFARIGALTFGGGYAMLPMFKKELAEKKGWCTEEDILDYYAVAQCTPGVIAVNTASFVGMKIKGFFGALFATLGVVFPSVVIITAIAAFLGAFADNAYVAHALSGIRIAVCALVAVTVYGLFKKNVKDILTTVLTVGAFLFTVFLDVSPVVAVIVAAVAGIIYKSYTASRKEKEEKK